MLNKSLLITFLSFISIQILSQNILSYEDSIKVNGAGIWGGISWDGSNINITTMMSNQLHLKKFDTNLNDLGTSVQLSFTTDYQGSNIADHKHVYLNGYLYISFMTGGNKELFLLKTDSLGNRVNIVTLETLSNTSYLTNDMHLVTDSNYIYVVYPKITGGLALNKRVRKYNLSLDSIDTYEAISPIAVAALGTTFYKDSMFYMFTGNENQNHLIVSRWDTDWTAQSDFYDTLITSTNGEWNYFSTGAAYDTANHLWYIAYHQMELNALPDHETIWLAVFDDNYNLLENQKITAPQHFRPHLLIHEGYLFMVYDGTAVTIKKFKIDASSISNVKNGKAFSEDVTLFPNPFRNKVSIKSGENVYKRASLYNGLGQLISEFDFVGFQNMDLSYLASGVYYLNFRSDNSISSSTIKLLKH